MAHLLLLSLANIDSNIQSKGSLRSFVLLALLPIASFIHKKSRVCTLLSDWLVHESLDFVLHPLKIAAAIGVMMSDPIGNLWYCFTPLIAYISDTPEQSLLSGTGPKASPVSTATHKEFGDPFPHLSRTATWTLDDIRQACSAADPNDFEEFLKVAKRYFLNGVHEPFYRNWLLSDPSIFLTPEMLHHFHCLFWDHDVPWCIFALGLDKIDYQFSLVQAPVGYRSFEEGISKLKQVMGHDHHAVQRYIMGVITGAVPVKFLAAIHFLLDFRYLAQMRRFDDNSLAKLEAALHNFYDNKSVIITAGARQGSNGPINHWEIPKLELLQHVISSIRNSGPIMQWTADITEHAHVTAIKQPARAGNNQDYYEQIVWHLDRSERCSRFDIATQFASIEQGEGGDDEDQEDGHEPDQEAGHTIPFRPSINYFEAANAIASGTVPTVCPHRIFASSTTAFRLALKLSLRISIDEAAQIYGLPDLQSAVTDHFFRTSYSAERWVVNLTTDKIQTWFKVRVQQPSCHDRRSLEPPQSLIASPPSS